jgi:hypothetical protein
MNVAADLERQANRRAGLRGTGTVLTERRGSVRTDPASTGGISEYAFARMYDAALIASSLSARMAWDLGPILLSLTLASCATGSGFAGAGPWHRHRPDRLYVAAGGLSLRVSQ